jgi:hypothetical protein
MKKIRFGKSSDSSEHIPSRKGYRDPVSDSCGKPSRSPKKMGQADCSACPIGYAF